MISKYPKAVLKGETQGYTISKYPKAVFRGESFEDIVYPCVSPLRTALNI
jgi:hypothetical protein